MSSPRPVAPISGTPQTSAAKRTQRVHWMQRFIEVMEITDRKSTRLNSSHQIISYAVFCLKKKKHRIPRLSSPRLYGALPRAVAALFGHHRGRTAAAAAPGRAARPLDARHPPARLAHESSL